MTTLEATMWADATKKIVTYVDHDLATDSFLDQTVHAHEHGVGLTQLGQLILDERLRVKPHN